MAQLKGEVVEDLEKSDLDTITIRISKGFRVDEAGKPIVETGEEKVRPAAGEPWLIGAGYTVRLAEGKLTSVIPAQHDYPANVKAALKTIRDFVFEIAEQKVSKAKSRREV